MRYLAFFGNKAQCMEVAETDYRKKKGLKATVRKTTAAERNFVRRLGDFRKNERATYVVVVTRE